MVLEFNFRKDADTTSFNSFSFNSFPLYVRLEDSGDSTGTGVGGLRSDAVIEDETDIGFFDTDDNPLDYYWVTFDTVNGVYEARISSDIVRDGTPDIQVGYGSGTTDYSSTKEAVWDAVPNLQGRYGFDESSGDLLDSTSNNNDGVLRNFDGDEQGFDSPMGSAYDLDGNSDAIDMGNIFNFTDEIAVLFWFYQRPLNSDYHMPFHKGPTNDAYLALNNDTTPQSGTEMGFRVESGSGFDEAYTTGLNEEQWYQAFGKADGSTLKLIIDDVEEDSLSFGYSPATGSNLGIGGATGNSLGEYNWNGRLAEMQFFNPVVSDDYAKSHFHMSPQDGYSLLSWNGTQTIGDTVGSVFQLAENGVKATTSQGVLKTNA